MSEAWVVEGRISDRPHAHPIQPAKGQHIVYVDTVAEGQIVAYLAVESPSKGAWVRLTGTALRFETTSPRPGSKKKFPVKQLTVETVERLDGSDAVQALLGNKPDDATRAAIEKAGVDAFPVLIAALENPRAGAKDWSAWWLANRTASFEAVRGELKPLIDEFFRSRGGVPAVP